MINLAVGKPSKSTIVHMQLLEKEKKRYSIEYFTTLKIQIMLSTSTPPFPSRHQSFVNLVEYFLHAVDIVLWFICQYLTTFSSLNSGQWIIIELNIASLTVLIDNIHSYFPPSR